jgi:hypothetical protein
MVRKNKEERREGTRDPKGQGKGFRSNFLKEFLFSFFSCIPPQEAKCPYFTSFILQNIAPKQAGS